MNGKVTKVIWKIPAKSKKTYDKMEKREDICELLKKGTERTMWLWRRQKVKAEGQQLCSQAEQGLAPGSLSHRQASGESPRRSLTPGVF